MELPVASSQQPAATEQQNNYTTMDTNKKEPQVRYSDEDLEEFKALILEKLEQAKTNLETLQANLSGGEHSTDDTAPTFKVLEDGYAVAQKEENAKLVSRQEKYIHNLELALMRIENKTYGICCETGRLIPKERLRCVPITTRCLDAKLKKK
jgi:RNA polymerase-binding transcription factor DksA